LHIPGSTVEYRNHPAVDEPFGLAEPLNVASLAVTDVAAEVVTVGGGGTAVVKFNSEPKLVPSELCAIAQ